ncbi:MAG TPA: bifunctional 4-hydroxy-3-methylbut-2-enyl diphosphate reductase/30S ribosomal protein S1 [Clostridiales bacterium]|nr:bifunctional 4-hydroxy-3-methylbut-2-enyl diphosphate reductase/30S ribosomal protein S1 [Clostridiales bacterium]
MKKLIVSKNAGFCFGVRRSVEMAEKALESPEDCYCLGQLIHNDSVVGMLSKKGLKTVNFVDELPEGARVIIRSHGIGRQQYEELRKLNAEIIDVTCPKVSQIHKIVSRASDEGRIPVIIGSEKHPEVIAIRGWCKDSYVFSSAESLEKWLLESPDRCNLPLALVFQTTQTTTELENCKKIIKKLCTNCEIFDTICGATYIRQEEARTLAKICDAMVVIGSKHSANSVHLAEICGEYCDTVRFIESADELDTSVFNSADTIGITAGASAPAWIIKEVKQRMIDEIKIDEVPAEEAVATAEAENASIEQTEQVTNEEAEAVQEEVIPEAEMSFDQLLEDSIKTIYNGDTVSGIVAAITPTEISVDLGTKHSGYIPIEDFTDDPSVKIDDILKVGDKIEAYVVRVNDMEGTIMLSKKRLDAINNWSDIEQAYKDGTAVEGVVTEDNKGGVVVSVKGVRVFVPASQTGLGRDVPMSELVKQKVRLKITEVNRSRRRVVGSIRAIQAKERRERAEKIWNEIEVDKRYDGVVKSLTSYGAFVDIGGIDGMVHVSELSWTRIKQPSDVLSVGDNIQVYVISFDKEAKRISLGYKDPNENPWLKFTNAYNVGDVVNVKIVKLMPFGAFAEILPGVDGLIHISQIANRRIGKPDDVLTVGDRVDAKITDINHEKQKVSLSIRALLEPEAPPAKAEAKPESESEPSPQEDALIYEVSTTGEATGIEPDDK